jgi:hypothetical protein
MVDPLICVLNESVNECGMSSSLNLLYSLIHKVKNPWFYSFIQSMNH